MSSGWSQEEAAPRHVVGIDLGTSNCAVAFVDTARDAAVHLFPVLQATAPGEVEAREVLPSCHYQPAPGELGEGGARLPWDAGEPETVVGLLAREQGARTPSRLVTSAKSWLSHRGIDRTARLLPWHGAPDVARLSPVEVSAALLRHLREAWDHGHPEEPLEAQDVVLTVPASFDEVARELTVEAARQAGLSRVTLLEEPQAAFYAWLNREDGPEADEDALAPGQTVLVCDVGGGTTDLTLIEVRRDEDDEPSFHRVAVGEHLILGGDNMDLALAHHVEEKLGGARLEPGVWSVLVRQCQGAKELLLGEDPPPRTTLSLPSGGARVVGGARQLTLEREEVREVLLDGFAPRVGADATAAPKASGFQEMGLPYAPDPGITRYLAEFLRRAGDGGAGPVRPDAVLFNGGLFESPQMRRRLLEVLASWFPGADGRPVVLRSRHLHLAVARGAASYGMARRGAGVRIEGGLPRSYYIAVEEAAGAARTALCLVPAGIREGESVEIDRELSLRIRQPVELEVLTSATRTTDSPGALVEIEPEALTPLPPIRTVITSGRKQEADEVRVRLTSNLTAVGTLETWCREVDGDRRWRLQFDARAASHTDLAPHRGEGEAAGILDQDLVEACAGTIRDTFASSTSPQAAQGLVKALEEASGMERDAWPPFLLRAFWEPLLETEAGRRQSAVHEARWLNFLGFCLRPGYGFALDDWRVATTWRLFLSDKVLHPRNELCRAEWWILWRRLAGGITPGQQQALADPALAILKAAEATRKGRPRASKGGLEYRGGSHETAELWRLLGALEWLDAGLKEELGEKALAAMEAEGPGVWNGAGSWALARLGARVPQHGPVNGVVAVETAQRWLERLLETGARDGRHLPFPLLLLARRSGDRYRDVEDSLRRRVLERLEALGAPAHYRRVVAEGGSLDEEAQKAAFGDSLPAGIRLA